MLGFVAGGSSQHRQETLSSPSQKGIVVASVLVGAFVSSRDLQVVAVSIERRL